MPPTRIRPRPCGPSRPSGRSGRRPWATAEALWQDLLAPAGGTPDEGACAWQVLQDWLDPSACGPRLRAFVSASPPGDPCGPVEPAPRSPAA